MSADLQPVADLTSRDRRQIAGVWHAALPTAEGDATPEAALLQRLAGDLLDCHAAVVRQDGVIVGFVVCDLRQHWLRQLFVLPSCQGQGHGTSLLALTMQALPEGWLRTDADNLRAQGFYASQGLRVRRRGPHPVSGAETVEYAWP